MFGNFRRPYGTPFVFVLQFTRQWNWRAIFSGPYGTDSALSPWAPFGGDGFAPQKLETGVICPPSVVAPEDAAPECVEFNFNASRRGEFMGKAVGNLEIAPSEQYQASQSTWDKIAESREFQDLMATKKVFIVPAFIFFVVYYFALPVLVGYAPQFMSTKVIGEVNLAYLFALSQFFVAWIIAGLYVKAANNFDRLAKDILDKAEFEKASDAKGGK
jgi:uncharacterized membrane protein (DUF485 family)